MGNDFKDLFGDWRPDDERRTPPEGVPAEPENFGRRPLNEKEVNVVGVYEEHSESEEELVSNIRIVHLCGRFTNHSFILNDRRIPSTFLPAIVNRALIVLDGSSKNRGPTGWADMEELTSTLINDGAIGCVVTVLPVKHDPIVAKVF